MARSSTLVWLAAGAHFAASCGGDNGNGDGDGDTGGDDGAAPAETPNPVIAASGSGVIEQRSVGFDDEVQPSGRLVDFYTSGITTSAAGGYYVAGFDGGTVGTIDNPGGPVTKTAWSSDDGVLVARTDDGISVFRID